MAMNKFMHPRNPYKKPPDFIQLSIDYPDLRKYVKPDLSGKVKLNFKCEGAVRELTKCLLHKDFSLVIDIPPNRLVPTLPLRMNYLLWIEDLLNESERQFHGIDIGTGASCIYPLLATRHFGWKMMGTEINKESIRYAVRNVEKNKLNDCIIVKEVDDSLMLDGALEEGIEYDFCMCNPPFYSDEAEMSGKARTNRRAPPRNHPSGQNFELVAPGGETAFISRIITDSVKLGCKIRVYTVMVGHKSNLGKIKEEVRKVNPVRMRTTEFCQGRTTRWGLAWTFCTDDNLISAAIQPRRDQLKPPYRWVYPGEQTLPSLRETLLQIFCQLNVIVNIIEDENGSCSMSLKAYKNTWSHLRKKRRHDKRKLIEKCIVSPCDSVVTVGSVGSNNSECPPSPTDSLGYSSLNDLDEEPTPLCVEASRTKQCDRSTSTLENTNDSNLEFEIKHSKNLETENVIEKDLPISGSKHNLSDQLSACAPGTSDDKFLHSDSSEGSSTNIKNKRKRKPDTASDCPNNKKTKIGSERPLLEALLVILEFNEDIIFSLSFIDGTGGRESANQVLQFLKNKLT